MSDQENPTNAAIPYLAIAGAAAAIEFYQRAFGAKEEYRLDDPRGIVGHAEITIAGARVMLSDEYPELDVRGPLALGGTPVGIQIQVPDVDRFVERATAEGARIIRPPADEFYGERSAKIEDPFGHVWYVSTRIEVLTPEEIRQRYQALMAK